MKREEILAILEERFNKNINYHKDLDWNDVLKCLDDEILDSIRYMEETCGEPDVVVINNDIYFVDTSLESPSGRRSYCYDDEALLKRKVNKPKSSIIREAHDHNVEVLNEYEYKYLQSLGDFDLKSTSWILTPDSIRNSGGAIFGDKKYNRVFIYHNSAESYYSNRGFRVKIKI